MDTVQAGWQKREIDMTDTVSKADFDELKTKFDALMSTNERILLEHKNDKATFANQKKDFEDAKIKKLEKNKDFEGLHLKSQEDLKAASDTISTLRANNFSKNLETEVAKLAKDALIPAQVMRSLIIGDKNTDLENGTLTDLSAQLDNLRKSEPNLFDPPKTKETTTVPRYMVINDNKEQSKTVGEMSVAEVEQSIRDHAAARSKTA